MKNSYKTSRFTYAYINGPVTLIVIHKISTMYIRSLEDIQLWGTPEFNCDISQLNSGVPHNCMSSRLLIYIVEILCITIRVTGPFMYAYVNLDVL